MLRLIGDSVIVWNVSLLVRRVFLAPCRVLIGVEYRDCVSGCAGACVTVVGACF